jgi:hypothetical protein
VRLDQGPVARHAAFDTHRVRHYLGLMDTMCFRLKAEATAAVSRSSLKKVATPHVDRDDE